MLSPKENMLRMYRGEMPEYIPMLGFKEFKCSGLIDVKKPGCKVDEFGVEYTGKQEVFGGAPIPFPGHYVLDDVTKWRDKIKAPDLSDLDWEALARKDLADIDRNARMRRYENALLMPIFCTIRAGIVLYDGATASGRL